MGPLRPYRASLLPRRPLGHAALCARSSAHVDRDKNTSLFATRRSSAARESFRQKLWRVRDAMSTAVPTHRDMPALRWPMVGRRIVASAETLMLFVEPCINVIYFYALKLFVSPRAGSRG